MISALIQWMNRLEKKDKGYISDTHRFLKHFDRKNPKRSKAQLHEIEKHRNIFNRPQDSRIQW